MRIILLGSLMVLVACGSTEGGADAPPGGADARADASGSPDAGGTPDSSALPDSAVLPDAAEACVSCSETLTNGEPPTCPGSAELFDAIAVCACEGACMPDCGDNACLGMEASAACQTCLFDEAAGCGGEINACLADT